MKTKRKLLMAGFFLAAVGTGFGQPVITTQPQSCTNAVGTTATFMVGATNSAPLAYQWQKLSGTWTDLTGCTDTNLVRSNVQTGHAGDYRAVVTNIDGAVTSAVAHLTVIVAPRITPTASLQHTTVFLGQSVTFSVSASGTAPLSYQWRRDGGDLMGKTNASLTIPAVQPAESSFPVVQSLYGPTTCKPLQDGLVIFCRLSAPESPSAR